jgi:class 3 adenylate cyclase
LVVNAGTPGEKRVPVGRRLFVGRECAGVEESQRLIIDDEAVSRDHLELRLEPELGAAYVLDVSANGTRVNGARIERATLVPLTHGDRLQIGDTELVFEAGAVPWVAGAEKRTTIRRLQPGLMAMVVGDILGFSDITLSTDSASLMDTLEALFGELRSLLRVQGGMLVNYSGDALFGTWELSSHPDGCDRALEFALAANQRVHEIGDRLPLSSEGEPPLRLGWGVTIGVATSGLLTGAVPTVVGDAANMAFRLSSLAARQGRAEILVATEVLDHLTAPATIGPPVELDIRGRAFPVVPLLPRTGA